MPFQPTARAAGTSVFIVVTESAARYQAIDLSTRFPNTDDPAAVKAVVIAALEAGRNQYALSHSVGELRQAVAGHIQRFYRQSVNPETKITIATGLLHIFGGRLPSQT